MGEVAVHLDDQIGAELDRLLEAGDVGATKTFLLLAVQTVDARLRFHDLLDDVTRPVRRVVVDKEKFYGLSLGV